MFGTNPLATVGMLLLSSIPLNALLQLNATPTKAVQGATDGQVDFAIAQSLNCVEVIEVSAAPGVRHRYGTPFGQSLNKILIYTTLKTLIIRGVNKKLGTVNDELGFVIAQSREHGV
ncbi:hypothetical protein PspLS_02342 [Pyricularia sp. CBS 133598]|nr:hypothetical protein PspLS_02342 [Pyricularia sp. CBS 133598]